ncbi:hypothetical protein [Geothrix fuzhouensis]|uniref:hypothetical protein n=1 Tax=Geothrix fuzhouensis TaxID=2966451 RepID=UPI00214840FD|nr:hypothetical protein [Geothrix fuzhouensis]
MTPMTKFLSASAALALTGFLACGGGGGGSSAPPPTATSLSYVDPTSGTYLLKKNIPLSTSTHLVLDLVGPASATGSGITATFSADPAKVAWTNVAATDTAGTFVQNGTAFNLGSAPQILRGKVTGGTLQVTAAQKGTGTPVSLNAPLLRIALDLKASQPSGTVSLNADATKGQVLDGTGALVSPITITVGTLSGQ